MDSKKKSFIINLLRRGTYRWAPRYTALVNARVGRGEYVCNSCGCIVGRKEIKVDHVNPVVPTTGWAGWDSYIDRMFPDNVSDFQCLCDHCHDIKTKDENELRKEARKKQKNT